MPQHKEDSMFTEYKFDRAAIQARVVELSANLRRNRGLSNLLAFGLSVVADRLSKDRQRYRDYGPWWPALKLVLNRNGYSMGDQSDPIVAREYSLPEDVETLIAANEFRDAYLDSQAIYTNRFLLDAEDPEFWVLFDADMEMPVG